MMSNMFPGAAIEIFYAVSLVTAAFGAGALLLMPAGKNPTHISALACGTALLAAIGVFLPGQAVSVMMWPLVPIGLWYIFPVIKRHRTLCAVTSLLMLFTLGAALLPPVEWDEQVYQTALLRTYSESGSFCVLPDNPYSAYPSLPHSFLRYAFSDGGVTVPRLVIWLLSGIISASFYLKFRGISEKLAAAVTAAVLLSPLSMILTKSFYAELYIVLFAFAGVEALMSDEDHLRNMIIAGIAAGAASSVKLTGAGVSLALLAIFICRRKNLRFKYLFFLSAILTALPFFLRVFLATGNPVYPYFSNLAGLGAGACGVENFHRMLGNHYGLDAFSGTLSGWVLTALRPELYDGVSSGWQFTVISAASLITAFTMIRKYPAGREKIFAASAALLTAYIFWGITARQSRFLYPLLWGGSALLLCCAGRLPEKWRRLIFFATLFATVTTFAVSNAPALLRSYIYSWRILASARADHRSFIAATDPQYAMLLNRADQLESDALCGLTLERRTLYFPRRAELIMPGFQEKLTPVPDEAEQVYELIRKFDYLVIMPPAADVDFAGSHLSEIKKLYNHAEQLRRAGKVIPLPEFQNMILRLAVEEAGTASASSDARSASVERNDAFARKVPGNPRPFK